MCTDPGTTSRAGNAVLGQPLIVLVGALAVLLAGGAAYRQLPVDTYPDISPALVQVFTLTEGLAPEEVERLVTYPVEVAMNGLPGLERIRSVSNFGLSVVNVYFEEGTDLYFARQLVNERLQEAREAIPEGLGVPEMGPASSGLGQVLFYYLEADPAAYDLEELRTLQDWVIKRNLQTVRGVTEVLSIGGHVREYQVVVAPDRLRQFGVSLGQVLEAVEANNLNVGASFLEMGQEEYLVRSVGMVHSVEDIRDITILTRQGTPLRVGDVADVEIGPEIRRGLATRDGEREVVAGLVLKLLGENTSTVVERVEDRLAEIEPALPPGVTIVPYYEQRTLTRRATYTVTLALAQGLVLVVLVLGLFLGDVRSSLVVALSLPFSLLFTFLLMHAFGLSANLMSLGGLAIGIGMMVDATIVVVENIHRRLREVPAPGASRRRVVAGALAEMGRPVAFSVAVIVLVFIPLFTLHGIEGTMFRPLAYTIAIAMVGSLIFALTVAPVLSERLLKGLGPGEGAFPGDTWIVRTVQEWYHPRLRIALERPRQVAALTLGLFALGASVIPFLGREFIPSLDEGTILVRATMAPSISLTESAATVQRLERIFREFPEVTRAVSRVGRGEIGAHSEPVNNAEIFLDLKPPAEWTTASSRESLVLAMRERLESFPGVQLTFTQPIAAAVDELVTGTRAQLAVKLFGTDLDVLRDQAHEIAEVLGSVEGASEVQVEQVEGQPQLRIDLDRAALSRYGIPVADAQQVIRTAVGGASGGQLLEGERRWTITVRYAPGARASVSDLAGLVLDGPDGARVPLAQVARIETVVGPRQISREDAQRFISVQTNVRGRDIGSFVAEARERIADEVTLPAGYLVTFGGQFELAQTANRRLAVVVPITALLIFLMLLASQGTLKDALLVLLNVPLALVGGLVALLVTGQNLSVPASVGFIGLFGIAVGNGLVLVTYITQLRSRDGLGVREAVELGTLRRIRPVLMTASTTALGLVPLLLATGPGSDVQRPLAVALAGGIVSSTALTLLVLPVLYAWASRDGMQGPRVDTAS
ncbi:MAG: efflux RND transporter permease subunit [Longimicrobiales bacterium]